MVACINSTSGDVTITQAFMTTLSLKWILSLAAAQTAPHTLAGAVNTHSSCRGGVSGASSKSQSSAPISDASQGTVLPGVWLHEPLFSSPLLEWLLSSYIPPTQEPLSERFDDHTGEAPFTTDPLPPRLDEVIRAALPATAATLTAAGADHRKSSTPRSRIFDVLPSLAPQNRGLLRGSTWCPCTCLWTIVVLPLESKSPLLSGPLHFPWESLKPQDLG